jgi:hypothetical protein
MGRLTVCRDDPVGVAVVRTEDPAWIARGLLRIGVRFEH